MKRIRTVRTVGVLVVVAAGMVMGATWKLVDGPFFELDGQAITGTSTYTTDLFGTHLWDAAAKCETCSNPKEESFPYAWLRVNVGLNGGPCSVFDPVRNYYYGGSGTSYGVPYIWVQVLSKDLEYPVGVTIWDESTCDGREYSLPGGNFYCT